MATPNRPEDPYRFLLLSMLEESFRTIRCYYSGIGSREELLDGKWSIQWMRKMEGSFRLAAIASGINIDEFHQLCMWKINQIRKEALDERKKYEQSTMDEEDREGEIRGETNLTMDS